MGSPLQQLIQVLKSNGGDLPEDIQKTAVSALGLGIGGALTPAAAKKYFTTVTDQSSFLGRVTSDQVDAIEQDVDLFHVASRQLQRVAEGSEPSTETGASNLGKRWYLKSVEMYPTILFSTLIQRGQFIDAYLADKFATTFRNDLLDLGINGDESSGTAFIALNDGWVEKASDAVNGTARDLTNAKTQRLSHGAVTGTLAVGEEVEGGTSGATGDILEIGSGYIELMNVVGTFAVGETLTGATSGATCDVTVLGVIGIDHMTSMDAMLQAMSDKWLNAGKTAFIMSKKDAIAWGKQMALKDGLNPYLISGNVPRYLGYEVIGESFMPSNTLMLTDPKNLAFGMGSTINRWRELRPRKRCIEYTWQLYSDYLILIDEAVVLSR